MFTNILAVGCGGFVGAICRYLCTILTSKIAYATVDKASFGFPIGILAINLIGCFLMGWLAMWLPQRFPGNSTLLLFVTTGLLGGYTTLSTFGLDTWKLFAGGQYWLGTINVVATLAVCFAGIIGGIALARAMMN